MIALPAGFAVIGDTQFLPGYAVLLVDELDVQWLSELPRGKRMAFLSDRSDLVRLSSFRRTWTGTPTSAIQVRPVWRKSWRRRCS